MISLAHDHASPLRLVVRILQALLAHETFASYADLADALKCRCAQLHLGYDSALVSAAIDQLERGGQTRLVDLKLPRRLVERPLVPDPDPISPADAAAILARLHATVKAPPAPPAHDAAHEARVRTQASTVRRRRRPFEDVLADIFDGDRP